MNRPVVTQIGQHWIQNRHAIHQVTGCIERAGLYGLTPDEAREIAHKQLDTIRTSWDEACDEARMTANERETYRNVFPHEYALIGL